VAKEPPLPHLFSFLYKFESRKLFSSSQINEKLMMERSESSSKMMKKKEITNDHGFVDTIFSWSLEDIFNENLFKVFTLSTFQYFHHSLFSYLFCKIRLLACDYYLQLLDYFTEQ
jgi:hypothetical protein